MFHILNPSNKSKLTYGFKTSLSPPQLAELKPFEDELFSLISHIKFRPFTNQLQQQLRTDKAKILEMKDVIVQADKSANLYKMNVDDYKKKVKENITKDYRKCPRSNFEDVIREAAVIAKSLDLHDRIDAPTEDEAFITVKDHKDSFPGRAEYRLINPSKNHIGSISKVILDRINNDLRSATRSNQWQNTDAAITWFKTIPSKHQKTFFKFDIVSFYPSIKQTLLMEAISWAKTYTTVPADELNVVLHCRKMFLFFEDECWVKKDNSNFDVSMGSLDSAEVCELVGLFLLSKMESLIPKEWIGLYRDDGLAVVDLPGPDVDRLRKKVIQMFSGYNLKITTEVNIMRTDFLDVMFDLETGTYKPFRKDSNTPLYINHNSNHPHHVKKELPRMISRRVSSLSANKEVFNAEIPLYKSALQTAGFNEDLQYIETQTERKKKRKRNVIWFNPPWNDEVSTNVAKKFLGMVARHFPKGSALGKHFNKNTIKVSYSTMPNMERIISGHNKKMVGQTPLLKEKGCNCRRPQECPLDGRCQTSDIIYKSSVKSGSSTREYIGLTSTSFKQRYTAHKASFTHRNKAHNTSLSTHIWKLKDDQAPFSTSWSILGMAPSYSRKVRNCQLCLKEKAYISLADPSKTLNRRNEIISKCRHRDKLLLKNW